MCADTACLQPASLSLARSPSLSIHPIIDPSIYACTCVHALMHLHADVHDLTHTRVDTRAREHLGNPGEERARDQGPRALALQLSRPHHLTCDVYVCIHVLLRHLCYSAMCMYAFMSACVRLCPHVNIGFRV